MSEFKKKHEYQEITIAAFPEIYKIANEYNSFYNLPRQGRGDPGDVRTSLQSFYRGQSDSSWEIIPSICRNKSVIESVPEHGDLLFEKIAHNQHYKQGTRLIDFTTDIDVALYFACCENLDKDAAIFIWLYAPYESNWKRTMIQCELVNIEKERISICEFTELLFNQYSDLKEMYSYKADFYADLVSYLDHGFMVIQPCNSKIENLRMQRQRGCLYVCGVKFETPIDKMRTSSSAGNNIFCPHEVVPPKELDGGNTLVKVIIPSRLKCAIMKHLEEKGITEKFLLPE